MDRVECALFPPTCGVPSPDCPLPGVTTLCPTRLAEVAGSTRGCAGGSTGGVCDELAAAAPLLVAPCSRRCRRGVHGRAGMRTGTGVSASIVGPLTLEHIPGAAKTLRTPSSRTWVLLHPIMIPLCRQHKTQHCFGKIRQLWQIMTATQQQHYRILSQYTYNRQYKRRQYKRWSKTHNSGRPRPARWCPPPICCSSSTAPYLPSPVQSGSGREQRSNLCP
jgi:hypothetical protein